MLVGKKKAIEKDQETMKPAGAETAELSEKELERISGGRVFRITNVRANASGVGGGGVSGTLP